jgi:hypothetical protein
MGIVTPGFMIIVAVATQPTQHDDACRAIIKRAVIAHGGEQNILKLRIADVKYTSTLVLPGMGTAEVSVSDTYQLPKQFKKVTKGKQGDKEIDLTWAVIDGGEKWWYRDGSGKTVVVNERRDIETLYRPYLVLEQIVFIFNDKDAKLTALPERKANKQAFVGFRFTPAVGAATDMFFDKDTGLLALTVVKRILPGASREGIQETFFSDYKKTENAMLFHKQTSVHDMKQVGEVIITTVKTSEKFDDKVFAMP